MDPAALTLTALVAAITAVVVRRHGWLTRVRSWSMYPTLQPGDVHLTRAIARPDHLRRGDIVVIQSAELGRDVIKRIIGLPGETVDISADGVSIDGLGVPEPYRTILGGPAGTFHVPAGTYLVLGDNRPRSSDSRTWTQPYVPAAAVRGRVTSRQLLRHRRSTQQLPATMGL